MNCEFDPLIDGNCEDPIIKVIPPPPLHTILLGPVNHIFKELKKRFPKILQIVSELHIQRAKYHGRNFEGNQCRAILKKIEQMKIPDCFKEFKDVLLALKEIHEVCNAQLLSSNYHMVIDRFRSAWFKLTEEYPNISTTPKIHVILDHLEDYFDETNMTLIKTTDELVENMHQYLHKRLMRSLYLVKDLKNKNQGRKLFRAVRHLNSYNIILGKKSRSAAARKS